MYVVIVADKGRIIRHKTLCRHKEKCYRKNPDHLAEFSHPHLEELLKDKIHKDVDFNELLPENCKDKGLMIKQLQQLQVILREKYAAPPTPPESEATSPVDSIVDSTKSLSIKDSDDASTITKLISTLPTLENPSFKLSSFKRLIKLNSEVTLEAEWKKTLINSYENCESQEERDKIRIVAIDKMKAAGTETGHLKIPGEFKIKYDIAKPYFMFFSTIEESSATWEQLNSITFPEILDKSFGVILKSLHINYKVDTAWLKWQYVLAGQKFNSLVFYSELFDVENISKSIDIEYIQPSTKSGLHHSKISVLLYDDGARIIMPSCNLYEFDWKNRTQLIWISPHLYYLSDNKKSTDGDSKTGFKKDFINYMKEYKNHKLHDWIDVLSKLDYSSINVFFVASVPGHYKDQKYNNSIERWGLLKLSKLLKNHVKLTDDSEKWPIVVQTSSIGSFGKSFDEYLGLEVLPCLSSCDKNDKSKRPDLKYIYPTKKNYDDSYERKTLTSPNPYCSDVHEKQKDWLNGHLYEWKSDGIERNKTMPHGKCYTRLSPDCKNISWFFFTSANLSKSAWGQYWYGYDAKIRTINNYEAGILFIPKFLTEENTFPIGDKNENGTPPFPLPYDVPLTPYETDDEPFVREYLDVIASQEKPAE
ncbi:hypothetical protein HCN44_000929 [Aphidius gifuensis]|uniref:PBZ-type domain-containing protein n=1 Tax=Aphidius gifuensis TaxID=684658 RepID=A0A834XLU0_APHGI|nr:hypothetical protein HCN44_000929 [Aphidius gifuensis]